MYIDWQHEMSGTRWPWPAARNAEAQTGAPAGSASQGAHLYMRMYVCVYTYMHRYWKAARPNRLPWSAGNWVEG